MVKQLLVFPLNNRERALPGLVITAAASAPDYNTVLGDNNLCQTPTQYKLLYPLLLPQGLTVDQM